MDAGAAALSAQLLALAFATIERPIVAQRLIRSVRQHFPTMPIYVADQSLQVSAMAEFYAAMNVTLVRMAFDAGVCASRNRLAAAIREPYFVLCDDDFVLGADTDFSDALRILARHPQIGVIGGKLYDYEDSVEQEFARHWELFLHLDPVNRTLTSVPITHYAPRARQIGAVRYYMCDAVMNFAVLRRAIFEGDAAATGGRAGWDERFKSNGEHEDFFLNLKMNTAVQVAYLPTMVAYHHHPEAFSAYRHNLRDRLDGWRRFLAKWEIDQHLEIGLGVRTIDDLAACVPEMTTEDRFYLNDDLSLRRTVAGPHTLQITEATRLSAIGSLDAAGTRCADTPAATRLLIRSGGGVRPGIDDDVPVQTARPAARAPNESRRFRYEIEAPARGGRSTRPVCVRYNPVARTDADFILWYRPADAPGPDPDGLAVTLRWTAGDGRILLWESRCHRLDLTDDLYWRPLLVDMPVLPADAAFMRFEVIAATTAGPRVLAIGFVFAAAAGRGETPRETPPAFDALALAAWTAREALVWSPPAMNLATLRCQAVPAPMEVVRPPGLPGLMLIGLHGLQAGERMLLVDWPALGATLAYGPCAGGTAGMANAAAAEWIAVPRPAPDRAPPRLLGYRPESGFRTLAFAAAPQPMASMPG